jgi:hypothetical protein
VIIVVAVLIAFQMTRKKGMSFEMSASGDGHEWSMGEEPVDGDLFADDDDVQIFAGVFEDHPLPIPGNYGEAE